MMTDSFKIYLNVLLFVAPVGVCWYDSLISIVSVINADRSSTAVINAPVQRAPLYVQINCLILLEDYIFLGPKLILRGLMAFYVP